MNREFVAGVVGVLLVLAFVASCGAAREAEHAEHAGRYQIVAGAQGGIARIDTVTGQVWLIQGGDQGVAWQAVPQPAP